MADSLVIIIACTNNAKEKEKLKISYGYNILRIGRQKMSIHVLCHYASQVHVVVTKAHLIEVPMAIVVHLMQIF